MAIKTHRIFFAIPFDTATMQMYEEITTRLKSNYNITTITGTKEIGPSTQYSEIASFKAQNTEMISQMRQEIERADIVVADMTSNNPNVHFELGIALYLNKNILKMTGRSLTELGFDVRGLEVSTYKTSSDLYDKITKYIELFLKIKELPLDQTAGPLYRSLPGRILRANRLQGLDLEPIMGFRMKDGAVKATFSFGGTQSNEDWFGIYVRFGANPFLSSYLVYVRKDGRLEIASYPGIRVIERWENFFPDVIEGEKTILLELDGDTARITSDGSIRTSNKLSLQVEGNVWLASWQSDVPFRDVEAVCRDTINQRYD